MLYHPREAGCRICCHCMGPNSTKAEKAVEMVQRRATRFAVGDYRTTSSVTKAMEELKWLTLEQRRVGRL